MTRSELLFVAGVTVGVALLTASSIQFWIGLAVAVAAFSLLWLASLALANASIADVFWGPGIVLIGWLYLAVTGGPPTPRGLVACGLVTVWGLRLGLHIGLRNAGLGEDFRYRAWREQAGSSFWWRSYLKVFLLQAVVAWVVSSPLLLAARRGTGGRWTVLDGVGLTMFVVGFGFEAVADWQLARFKADPANHGRVMRSGLWSLSRHPNYFGEALLWWGIGVLALFAGGPLVLYGPALLTFLLLRVSGVALLERALVERRPGYAEYVREVPAFFPFVHRRRRAAGS